MFTFFVAMFLSIFSEETLVERSRYIRLVAYRMAMMAGGEYLPVRPVWLATHGRTVTVAQERVPLGEVLDGTWGGRKVLIGFWF